MDIQQKIEDAIPKDKALHALGGYLIYCITRWSTPYWGREISIIISIIAVLLIAIGKEIIIDKMIRKKDIDWYDSMATIIGAIPVMINDIIT